jgi:HEAT repeat protein
MNRGFFLKLVIGIVAGFGLLTAGFYVYEPVWFKIQEYRLMSDDPATVQSAARAIAEKGKSAIPRIRNWLKSPSDRLVIGACKALENMSGDTWQEVLPELEIILKGKNQSRDDASASVIFIKEYACFIDDAGISGPLRWKHYQEDKEIRFKILHYILSNIDETYWIINAIEELRLLGDNRAVLPLIKILESNSDLNIRYLTVLALCDFVDKRAIPTLIKSLKLDPESIVRAEAATALNIGGAQAVFPLIEALENDSSPIVRSSAAFALGIIGDKNAVIPLINALDKDANAEVRMRSAESLNKFRDDRANGVLKKTFDNDSNPEVRIWCAFTLIEIGDKNALDFFIKNLDMILNPDRFTCSFLEIALILGRLPEECPHFDFDENLSKRIMQTTSIKDWYEKNKFRLAWDGEKRKYFLKP